MIQGIRRVLAVLTVPQRRRAGRLLALTLAVAAFELVGVGGILPLMRLMTEPAQALSEPWLRALYDASGAASTAQFVWRFGAALLVFYLAKTSLAAYTLHRGFRFSYDVQVSLGARVLRGYLARDYEFFLRENSAVLLKNVTSEVLLVAGGVLIPGMTLLTHALTIVAVTALLAAVSPGAALLAVGFIGGITVLLYLLIHRRLTGWGRVREERLAALNRIAHQGLVGVKAVKTLGVEEHYVEAFRREGTAYAVSNTRYQTAAAAPPLLIELLLFGGAVVVLLWYSARGLSVAALLPIASLLGAAAYRILPAARMAFANVVTIRYHWDAFIAVEAALSGLRSAPQPSTTPEADAPLPPFATQIELDGVSYGYPGGAVVLRDVSVRVPAGARVAIVGSSGAGKTTTVDILLALLEPSAGELRVDGVPVTRATRRAWQRQIGYVPQQPFLADATLRQNVAFGVPADHVDDARVLESLQRASLGALLARLPEGLDTPLGESGVRLSGGERQRVAIARALYARPRILVLDEATSALDTVTERQINEDVIAATGDITVVIVTHRLATVRACDEIVLLREGRVAARGTYEMLQRSSPEFAAMDRPEAAVAGVGAASR